MSNNEKLREIASVLASNMLENVEPLSVYETSENEELTEDEVATVMDMVQGATILLNEDASPTLVDIEEMPTGTIIAGVAHNGEPVAILRTVDGSWAVAGQPQRNASEAIHKALGHTDARVIRRGM